MNLNDLKLVHYAGYPFDLNDFQEIEKLKTVFDLEEDFHEQNYHKPTGLWLSVDSEKENWENYCHKNNFHKELLEYVHDILLTNDHNILFLDSVVKILEFNEKFRNKNINFSSISWWEVMKIYDGIIISPYQSSLRRNATTDWYYPWDCASGCIWRKRAIESITLRRKY